MAPRALLEAVAHNATEHHDSCDAPALSYLDNWFGDHEAHDEEGGGAALILVGVLMCAVGSICQNFGNNVMSLGHRKKAEHEVRTASARQLLAQPPSDADEPAAELDVGDGKKENFILLVGRAIFVTGALLIFGSFAFAPLAMLAPMEAIQARARVPRPARASPTPGARLSRCDPPFRPSHPSRSSSRTWSSPST